MDISKLPKLSNTPAPPPDSPEPSAPPPRTTPPIPAVAAFNIGPEFWFNTIVGLLLLYLGRRFAAYLLARTFGRVFHTGIVDDQGTEVRYPDLLGHLMLTEGGIFLFGLVVLLEAGLKAAAGLGYRIPAAITWTIFALAAFTTAFNIYVCSVFLREGSTPLLSGLAVAFGGFIMADIWRIHRGNQPVKF
jgi:hypothetical protein